MPTTTNFGWTTPADTDLVKDGAAAIRTLGSGIDTSLVDLKGGTTGQVLSKASNTDLDYTWTTPADQTPLTTKGDLFTFSTVDARLGVGTNGQYLAADSSTTTGLKWETLPPSGKVLQVVQGTKTDTASVTGTTWTGTGVSVSITPAANTSKVLVMAQITAGWDATATQGYFAIYRAGSVIFQGDAAGNRPRIGGQPQIPSATFPATFPLIYLDSPSTTSATTYEIYYRTYTAGTTVYINRSNTDTNLTDYSPRGTSSIILLEIGA